MPPRRATVSAIRRPATAVMLATTTGMVVPGAVDGGQVDVEAGGDLGTRRDEEDVAVGEVGGGRVAGQEAHGCSPFRSMVVARRAALHGACTRARPARARASGPRRSTVRASFRRPHGAASSPHTGGGGTAWVMLDAHQLPGRRAPARPRARLDDLAAEIRTFLVEPVSRTGRAPRSQPRRRRADHRAAPGVRLAARHHGLRHRPPGLRAQAAHRPPDFSAAAPARAGCPGYPSRAESEHDVVENSHASTALSLGRRHRQGQRAARPRRPARRRGHRRRCAHRRHGLGGAQQHRRRAGPPARDRRQRQRPLLRADDRRPRAPPRHAAHHARLRERPGLGQAHAAALRPAGPRRRTTRCTA